MEKNCCKMIHLCLVGANRFQNDLLITSMKEILLCKCRFTAITSCSELSTVVWEETGRQNLVYLDCFDLKHGEVKHLLHSAHRSIPSGTLLALYNLPENATYEKMALPLGVRGFFYSSGSPAQFCRGNRAILNGEIWLSRKKLSSYVLDGVGGLPRLRSNGHASADNLTLREIEILTRVAAGVTNKGIAADMNISVHTVRTHIYNIFGKIKVKNRMQASLWSLENL